MAKFVHLHVHSDFSLQDAAVSVMALADRAEELGMSHLALTDHGNMFGAMDFLDACTETVTTGEDGKEKHIKRKNPVKPIVGCEVYVSPGSRFEKKGSESDNKYYHLVLLAANRSGYLNLVKLCSFAYTEGFYHRPRIDEELLTQYHEGLIALSACVSGEIPRLIQAGKQEDALQKALYYRDLFGKDVQGNPNFYLEIQDHGIPAENLRNTDLSQKDINKVIINIAEKTGIPLVATNDVHYLNREDYIAHDILLCIGTGKVRSEEKRKKYYGDQFYLKSAEQMAALFPDYPEAIENTVRIAERCITDVPAVADKELPEYLPDFDIPPGFENAGAYLRKLASDGLEQRYARERAANSGKWADIMQRAEYELDTIIRMGYSGYYLIVWDFINWAREHDISVGPGRGSGAGSIIAYALRITDIDPLEYGLLFERFLNPERVSMPDFDIDFANDGRDDVIKYVTGKYGKSRVGQIITFGTLGAKAVVKDVARVLGISIPESEMITKLIPVPRDAGDNITLKKSLERVPRLKELQGDPKYAELFELAMKLEGLNRHSSLHAAGVVISKTELVNLVPLFRDPKTEGIATQFDMKHLEKCGLVKMDFLGLKTLDVIKNTEELIRSRGGEYEHFDVEQAPDDDAAVYKMLGEGKSYEVFQFESDGMQNVLKQAKPGKVEDLIALNALYRPGPMDNIQQFIDSKNGRKPISYPHPSLENVLKETYGVIVYQEQVMHAAQIVAGFSLGRADELRRAMGKKIKEKMDKEKVNFFAGAKERGYSERKITEIWELLIPFSGYGFNKSHAAAYAVLAYRTAYLKVHFPAEFMAANLTNEINSTDKDKLSECINEARKMGLEIEAPDINRSEKLFCVVDGRIIYGFLGIKGLGDATAGEIVRCRKEGPYKNFMDFIDRVDLKVTGKSAIEKLIQTGAFDSFGQKRETLLGNLERAVDFAQKKKDEKQFGQTNLFEDAGVSELREFRFDEFPEMSRTEKLNIEKQLIGFYLSGHPMDEYREIWQKAVKVTLGDPDRLPAGSCLLVGIVRNIKVITGKSGEMAFANLSDYNGEIELTFFSRAWEKCRDRVEADKVAILRGKIDYQKDRDRYSFIVDDWLSRQEVDDAIKEDDERERKWEKFRNTWTYMADLKSGDLNNAEKGSYTILGILKSIRELEDRNGNAMAFGTLCDYEGDIDLVFFSRSWEESRDLLKINEFTALKGSIDPQGDQNRKLKFRVSSIADLALLSRSASRRIAAGDPPPARMNSAERQAENSVSQSESQFRTIHIRLKQDAAEQEENLFQLRDHLADNSGKYPVYIHITVPSGEKIIRTRSGIGETEDRVLTILNNCAAVAQAWRE